MHVLRHDADPLDVERTYIGVFELTDQDCFCRRPLHGQDGRQLEAGIFLGDHNLDHLAEHT